MIRILPLGSALFTIILSVGIFYFWKFDLIHYGQIFGKTIYFGQVGFIVLLIFLLVLLIITIGNWRKVWRTDDTIHVKNLIRHTRFSIPKTTYFIKEVEHRVGRIGDGPPVYTTYYELRLDDGSHMTLLYSSRFLARTKKIFDEIILTLDL